MLNVKNASPHTALKTVSAFMFNLAPALKFTSASVFPGVTDVDQPKKEYLSLFGFSVVNIKSAILALDE